MRITIICCLFIKGWALGSSIRSSHLSEAHVVTNPQRTGTKAQRSYNHEQLVKWLAHVTPQ